MASLSNTKIKDTYESLVKFSDNGNITIGAKQLTDGFGNNSPFFVSTTQIGIGVTPTVGYDLHVNSDAKIGGNLIVSGNLTVSGTLTYLDVEDLATEDPLIKLARNNAGNSFDIGYFGQYVESAVTKYKGLFNDADDNKFKLFIGTSTLPTTVVNTGGTGYTVGTLVANLEGNVTGTVSSLSNHTTTNLAEGTNLYYTNARADARVNLQTGANLDLSSKDTDDLSEGSTNLYFTTTRARASFTEGTGVTITDGEIAIGQAVATDSNVTFNNIAGEKLSLGTTNTGQLITMSGAGTTTNGERGIRIISTSNVGFSEIQFKSDDEEFRIGVGGSSTAGVFRDKLYLYSQTGGIIASFSETLNTILGGDLTMSGGIQATTGSFSGLVTATGFSGPLTGNVTGNLTGNVTGDITGNAYLNTIAYQGGEGTELDNSAFNVDGIGTNFRWIESNSGSTGSTWKKVADVVLNNVGFKNGVQIEVKVLQPNTYWGDNASLNTIYYSIAFRGDESDAGPFYDDALVYGQDANLIRVYKTSAHNYELQARSNDDNRDLIVECNITSKRSAKVTFTTAYTDGTATGGTAYTASRNVLNKTKFAGNVEFEGAVFDDAEVEDLRVNEFLYFGSGATSGYGPHIQHSDSGGTGKGMRITVDSDLQVWGVTGNAGEQNQGLYVAGGVAKLYDSNGVVLETVLGGVDITGTLEVSSTITGDVTGDLTGSVTGAASLNVLKAGDTMTGDLILNDDVKANFGTDSDLEIYHDGTDGYIDNINGELIIQNNSNDKKIIFKSDNGIGDITEYFRIDGNINRNVITVTTQLNDNVPLIFGSGAGSPSIKYDSTATQLFISGESKFLNDLYVVETITSTKDGIALQMDGGASAEGIRMTVDSSSTYPTFLRSTNPASGESSPWIYKESVSAWGIWHNNPINSFDFTRSTTTGIEQNVGGETNTVMIRLNNTDGSGTFVGNVITPEIDLPSGGMVDWANGDARIVEGLVNNYSLSFQTYDGTNVTTALRLDGNNTATFTGSVGIGGSPSNKLEVLGGDIRVSNAASTTDVKINNSTTGLLNSDLHLAVLNSGEGQVRMYGNYPLTFYTNNTQRMKITSGGKVEIATISNATTDTDKFLVSDSGEIKYRTGAEVATDISATLNGNYVKYNGTTQSTASSVTIKLKNTVTTAAGYNEMQLLNDNDDRMVVGSIGSGYTDSAFSNSAYVYATGTGRNLYLKSQSGNVSIFAGGFALSDVKIQVNDSNTQFNNNIYVNDYKSLIFERGSSDYSNIITTTNYPSQGYTTAAGNYWLKASSKGGFHIVLNSDGTNTSAENTFDDFVIFQGVHDGTPRFRVSNIGSGYFSNRLAVATVGVTPVGTMEVGKPLATDTMLTLSSLYSGANGGPTLNFRSGHSNNAIVWNMAQILVTDDSNYNGRIEFKTTNAGGGNSDPQVQPTTKMVLKSDGSLGINITNLTAGGFTPKLALKQTSNSTWGGINVESAIDDSVFSFSNEGGRHKIGGSYRASAGYKPLDFAIGGSTRMTLDTSGNLSVSGTVETTQITATNGLNYLKRNTDASLQLRSENTRSGLFITKPATDTVMGSALVLADESYRLGTASYYHMLMLQNGNTYFNQNVGIGTDSSPSHRLVVYETGDVWHTKIGNDTGQLRIGGQTSSGAVIQSRTNSGTARDLYLQRDGGRVGIGVNITSHKLHVDDATNGWLAKFENDAAENVAVYVSHGSGYGMAIDSTENDAKYLLKLAGGNGGGTGRGSQIRMFVESSGKVGIGSSTPDNQLTVKAANCIIDAQSTADSQTIGFRAGYLNNANLCGFFRYTTADAQLYIDNNFVGNNAVYSDINFRNKTTGSVLTNRMKIKGSTGYVGIANLDPLRLFDARGLGMFNGPTSSNGGSYIYDGYVDSSSAYLHQPGLMVRYDSAATGGIDEAPVGLCIHNESGPDNSMMKISFASKETSGGGNTVTVAGIMARKTAGISGSWASGELSLFTKAGSAFREGMIMDSAGRSTFYYTTKHTKGIRLNRAGSASTGISWYNDTYYNWQNYMASAGAANCGPNANLTAPTGLSSVTSWALRSRMEGVSTYGWIWETGGSGGGGATASAKMELGATNGTLRVTGDLVAYASDKRLKTNVKNISNPIEKIKQINGVEYDWVDDIKEKYDFHPNNMHEVGVLAQEIEKVLPEAVLTAPMNAPYKEKTGEDHNFLTVKYERIVPLLIEAIKEQQKQIDELSKKINNCKK